MDKDELLALWLTDQLLDIVTEEEQALKALEMATNDIKEIKKNKVSK